MVIEPLLNSEILTASDFGTGLHRERVPKGVLQRAGAGRGKS